MESPPNHPFEALKGLVMYSVPSTRLHTFDLLPAPASTVASLTDFCQVAKLNLIKNVGRQAGFEDSFAPKQTHHALSMVRSTKHAGSLDSLIAMFQHTNISAMSTSYRAQDLISGMTEWRAHASAALESCFCLWLTKSNDDRPGRPSGMAQNQLGSTPSAMLKGRRMRWLRVI